MRCCRGLLAVVVAARAASVVNFELGLAADPALAPSGGSWLPLRIGDRRLICSVDPVYVPPEVDSVWSQADMSWTQRSQTIRHLADSKTVSLSEMCFVVDGGPVAYQLELCVNRYVAAVSSEDERKVLGNWQRHFDAVYADGSLRQQYADPQRAGSPRVSVTFECSTVRHPHVAAIDGRADSLALTVEGAMFCDWAHWAAPDAPLPALLLAGLESGCQSLAGVNETFEFCWPHRLVRAIEETDGSSAKQELLGGLHVLPHGTAGRLDGLAEEEEQPTAAAVLIQYPSVYTEIVDAPSAVEEEFSGTLNILGQRRQAVKLELPDGQRCAGNTTRSTAHVFFVCPIDWQRYTDPKFVYVTQRETCLWEAILVVPALCSHPLFLPAPQYTESTVQCWPVDEGDDDSAAEPERGFDEEDENLLVAYTADAEPRAGFNSLAVLHSPETINSAVETSDVLRPRQDSTFFALGMYLRNLDDAPFELGERVRHVKLQVSGVVLGWDPQCRAPLAWKKAFVAARPQVSLDQPFVRVLLDGGVELYSPYCFLQSDPADRLGLSETLLERFFTRGQEDGRWIPRDVLEATNYVRKHFSSLERNVARTVLRNHTDAF